METNKSNAKGFKCRNRQEFKWVKKTIQVDLYKWALNLYNLMDEIWQCFWEKKMDQVYLEIHAVVSLNVNLRGVGLVANDIESLPEGWTWCSCQHGVSPSFDGGHKHVVEGSQLIYSCRYSPYLLNNLNNSCSSEESIQRINLTQDYAQCWSFPPQFFSSKIATKTCFRIHRTKWLSITPSFWQSSLPRVHCINHLNDKTETLDILINRTNHLECFPRRNCCSVHNHLLSSTSFSGHKSSFGSWLQRDFCSILIISSDVTFVTECAFKALKGCKYLLQILNKVDRFRSF